MQRNYRFVIISVSREENSLSCSTEWTLLRQTGSNHKGALVTTNDRLTSKVWIRKLSGKDAVQLAFLYSRCSHENLEVGGQIYRQGSMG